MSDRADGPIDWTLAERVAIKVAARHASPPGYLAPRDAELVPMVTLAEGLVADETRLRPPTSAKVHVVGRDDWIRANLAGFRSLIGPVASTWFGTNVGDDADAGGGSPSGRRPTRVGRGVTAVELGTMLGWMSGRVLGQYDVLAGQQGVGAENSDDEAVYLVGPNLVTLERKHGFDPDQFRLWVTLHELTHRAQFLGVPWMRDHYRGLVHEVVGMIQPDPAQLLAAMRDAIRDRSSARARIHEGGLAVLLATDEQRETIRSVGGLMSLLEGHGDVVMDRAGGAHVPDAPRFASVLRQRRTSLHPVTKLVLRLLGVEAKLRQYQVGERFVARVEAVAGACAIDRCWESAEQLPSWDEVRDPDAWLARVGATRV